MSAARILILGILNDKKPRHGYEVRQELESWGVEKWANVGYGSIYFALKKMAEEGLLAIVQQENDGDRPDKIVYQITDKGTNIFLSLLRRQWLEIKPLIDPFQVALTFMQYMPKDELITSLEHRIDCLRLFLKSAKRLVPIEVRSLNLPPHINESQKLVMAHYQTELEWIESAIKKVKNDEMP